MVSGPLKNKKSLQILLKSWNLAEPSNGSQSLKFCVCWSHICFSIKSLNFSISVSDFKVPVSASQQVSDLPFATPQGNVGVNEKLTALALAKLNWLSKGLNRCKELCLVLVFTFFLEYHHLLGYEWYSRKVT